MVYFITKDLNLEKLGNKMSNTSTILIVILTLIFMGCNAEGYHTYAERDVDVVRKGINPISIPSAKEYSDYIENKNMSKFPNDAQ